MSEVLTEQNNSEPATPPITKKRHLYFMENTPEETIRRMRALPERIAELRKRLEKLNADRTTDAG
jgi:hypothetical protein